MSLPVHGWESSPLLTPISAVTGVLAVVAAIWATLYASRPRRALAYSIKMQHPIDGYERGRVNLVVPNEEQQRAVIVTFVLRGTGRLDVPTSVFDSSTPITLGVMGGEIRGADKVESRRGGGLVPAFKVGDNNLEIGPGLIGRNQVLTFTLVAVTRNELDSSGPLCFTLTNALIDTRLRNYNWDISIRIGLIGVVFAVFLVLWYIWLSHIPVIGHTENLLTYIAAGVGSITILVAGVLGGLVARQRHPEPPQAVSPNKRAP
jgi:hypothetical protein